MTLIEVSQEVSRGLRKEKSQLERDVGKKPNIYHGKDCWIWDEGF